jgi:hypothetical protein
MSIRRINISPESVKEAHFPYAADIEDGWVYQLDKNGNVMKDASGNDVKIINLIRVQCDYIETLQRKEAHVSGNLDIRETASGKILRSISLGTDAVFDYPSAAIAGDFRALPPGMRKKLRPGVPFPTNADMLLQAASTMKNSIREILRDNRDIFK